MSLCLTRVGRDSSAAAWRSAKRGACWLTRGSCRFAPIGRLIVHTDCRAAVRAHRAERDEFRAADGGEAAFENHHEPDPGEIFRHELPGAGGWGPALQRDLDLVARDLRDGLVSIAAAAQDYGVVAAGDPPVIDAVATEALRARLRSQRKPLPAVAWEPAA